ncbi:DUF4421 family protein [Chryseobacterium culicis]|uniref:DUF4421 domain-containing protein n=1 Tax=Chryseobacterium culicis TaxID=680127 RepID=A0A2S9CRH4_CHRCI|nr:DUF4421 family protein [Chryseobacterium culicis]PRB83123.1 hypothetical protein CQ022_13430 [Chryseobacterium culicis]PRB89365.1 hypothetical protein CQ033_12330 [Chryseobacterium culicis]
MLFSCIFYAKCQTDTTLVKSYSDQVMIRLNLDTNIEKYILSQGGKHIGNNKIDLSINNKTRTSISVDYRAISATLSFSPKFIPGNNEDDLKGKSSYTDLSFRFFPKRFIQTLYYKKVKGFYVENMKDIISDWQEAKDGYLQFPDLKVLSFGGTTSYVLNKNFSAKSIYTQSEWQKKSSGSWVPYLDYDVSFFTNTTNEVKSREVQYKIGGNMGYFYNWIIKDKVNIAPYLSVGLGGQFSSSREGNEPKENEQFLTLRMDGGLHIGYNSERFLFGGRMNFKTYTYQKNGEAVENNNLYGLLYIGYRFAPPKVVKNTYDKIQKKIPLL